jgi:integrase
MAKRGHGEGSIFQRKDGRWVATVNLGYEGGRRSRKSFYGRTRGEVKDALAKTLRDVQLGLPVKGDERETVGHYLHRWLDASAPSVRARTVRGYRSIIEQHLVPGIGQVPLAKLSAAQVQTMLNHKASAAPQTVRNIHAVLRRALNQAMRWGLVPRNVATLVDLPRARRHEVVALAARDARSILDAMSGDRLEPLVTVTLLTGLRQGEVLGLRWQDIDLEAGSLTVRHALQRMDRRVELVEPKTGRSRRTLALAPTALAALREQRKVQLQDRLWAGSRWQEGDFVFTTSKGTPLTGAEVTRQFQRLLAAAGVARMRFHDLRHGCASLLLAQGVHPRVVMDQLGHSTITLTMNTYSHVVPELQREAADRMEAALAGA